MSIRILKLSLLTLVAMSIIAGSLFAAPTRVHETRKQAFEERELGIQRAQLGQQLPLWSCIPFVGILLSIALVPMIAPVFWHHHFPKIAFGWGLLFALPFVMIYGGIGLHEILHVMLGEYLPFIILLWGLFTVSGGIYFKGSLVGKPVVNIHPRDWNCPGVLDGYHWRRHSPDSTAYSRQQGTPVQSPHGCLLHISRGTLAAF